MTEYTPTTEEVREDFADFRRNDYFWKSRESLMRRSARRRRQFDRWLEQVKAEAWNARETMTMTDNRTNEPTEAQVVAAARAIADCHNPGMFEKYPDNWRVEARAALEAATRVPVQGEPNDDREALARALFIASDDFAYADRMANAWDAPGPHGRQRWYRYADAVLAAGFSRATVPDAANAAIARVRARLGDILPDWSDSGVIAVADILAALDGAPEPEEKP